MSRRPNRTEGSLGGSLGSSLVNSVKVQALSVQSDSTRSIGGRLGGHFDSLRGSIPQLQASLEELPTEGTKLVPEPAPPVIHASPPVAQWITPALVCAASYAFYNIFIKKGSYFIHPILGGVILQFVAALLGTGMMAALVCKGGPDSELHYDRSGLFWSCMAGLAVGLAEMLSFCVSGMGVPVTQSIPIIIGGSVMFGAVLGVLLLGEVMTWHGWLGVLLLVTGIALDATDPGEKAVEGGGGGEVGSAPVYIWIGPALLCAAAYAFYNIFIKKGSASINPILGGVILQFVAAIFGSVLLGIIILINGGVGGLQYSNTGLKWAACAGISVGLAEMLSFCVSGMGVQATQSIPVIIGGSVMFGAILGLIMLGETLMAQGWIGVAMLTIGIGFVATDPGEKMAGH